MENCYGDKFVGVWLCFAIERIPTILVSRHWVHVLAGSSMVMVDTMMRCIRSGEARRWVPGALGCCLRDEGITRPSELPDGCEGTKCRSARPGQHARLECIERLAGSAWRATAVGANTRYKVQISPGAPDEESWHVHGGCAERVRTVEGSSQHNVGSCVGHNCQDVLGALMGDTWRRLAPDDQDCFVQ